MSTFATTLQGVLTAIAEQDSNLKLIKWAVKVSKPAICDETRGRKGQAYEKKHKTLLIVRCAVVLNWTFTLVLFKD